MHDDELIPKISIRVCHLDYFIAGIYLKSKTNRNFPYFMSVNSSWFVVCVFLCIFFLTTEYIYKVYHEIYQINLNIWDSERA